jgi:hypothetical protein
MATVKKNALYNTLFTKETLFDFIAALVLLVKHRHWTQL